MVTLEALRARKGDALLLHRHDDVSRALVIIDGGPSGVFTSSLQPRLDAMRSELPRDDGDLPSLRIDTMIVSHIDDDHIVGLLDLTDHLIDQPNTGNRAYKIDAIWHNSFDAIVHDAAAALTTADGAVGTASVDELIVDLEMSMEGALVAASVPQGRRLAANARRLGIASNPPWNGPIVLDEARRGLAIAPGVAATVLCPSAEQLRDLERASAKVKPADAASAAAFVDTEVTNLSSIVVLLEVEGKTMLLTGDARGDHVLQGARGMGLLSDSNPTMHLDVLEVPHHGSNRSNDTELFDAFPADHYVISGNGEHGNPDVATVKSLIDSRCKVPGAFALYLTSAPEDYKPFRGQDYPVDELRSVLDPPIDAGVLTLVTPRPDELGVVVLP